MPKTAVVTVRIDPELKRQTEQVLKTLGLTPAQAINLFYTQVNLYQGLPFPVRVPNAETRQALADAHARRDLVGFDTPEELFADLGI